MRNLILILALGAALGPLTAFAQDPEGAAKPEPEKTQEQKDLEKYEKTIKDLPKFEGEFTFYRRKQEILLELKPDQLDKLFVANVTVALGAGSDGLQAGDPLQQDALDVFRFVRGNDDIRLVKPNLNFRWDPSDPLALSSSRSFPEAILDNYEIEAENPKTKTILVDFTEFFNGNLFQLPSAVRAAMGSGYSPDSGNNSVRSIKTFPENAVIQYTVHYRKSGGEDDSLAALLAALLGTSPMSPLADSRSLPLTLSTNLWMRKDTGYQPRLADPRVGYFATSFHDIGRIKSVDRTTRFIQRWNLKKKDPTAELSEPIQPIVWYLDPSIPEEYRQGVRDGILFWNKAYEKIGFKNALVVKDAPADGSIDHADIRHNVIRWTMTADQPYAVAWFRPDPITGEILSAAVTVDANYPASAFTEFREEVMGATNRTPWLDSEGRQSILTERIDKPFAQYGFHRVGCDHAQGFADQAAFAYTTMLAAGLPVDAKEYSRIMVADLVAHEVGHCLGLRHNFAASTLHTNAELADIDKVDNEAVAASVMDYTPLNLNAVLAGNRGYYNPKIGVYDAWAIRYGYMPFPNKTTEEERYDLDQIARLSGERGLIYLSDEDADGINPLSVRWDLGADTVGYLDVRNRAASLLQKYALTQAAMPGDSYARRNSLLLRAIRTRYSSSIIASRLIGGVEFRRHLKGDVNELPTLRPVPVDQQRAAITFICKNALVDPTINLPQDVLFGLSQDPNAGGSDYNAPLRDYIGTNQRLILASISSPTKLDAIAENAFKTKDKSQAYTLVEHFDRLFDAVFAELDSGQPISPLRRDLQRYYATILIGQASMNNGALNTDAQLLAARKVRILNAKISKARSSKMAKDELTALHLRQMQEDVQRFINRK